MLQTSHHADDASHASGTIASSFQASPQLHRPRGVPPRGRLPWQALGALFTFFFYRAIDFIRMFSFRLFFLTLLHLLYINV